MLSITPITGSNQYAAAHYFSSADDYYAKENPGEWQGLGAEALGLSGLIDRKQLARVLDGQLPNGRRIASTFDRLESKKRMGIDLTFAPPKSVSLQALVAGDKAVTEAHDHAVTSALQYAETLAVARKKVRGKSHRERTGNLVIGKFRHEMSRAKDPQLHTHAVILNMTRRADGAWRALSNEDIFALRTQIEAHYHAELAAGLQALRYTIRTVDETGIFELDHISREQIEAFSERSQVIEEALAQGGKTRATATTLEKQVIALATRARKDESDRDIVKQYWVEKSRQIGIDYGPRSIPDGRVRVPDARVLVEYSLPTGMTPAQAVVQYAINHLTERESVVGERKLTAVALQRAVGLAGPREVRAEISRLLHQGALIESVPTYKSAGDKHSPVMSSQGWRNFLRERKGWSEDEARQYVRNAVERGTLVVEERRFTTHTALKREKAILALERDGRGQVVPIVAGDVVRTALKRTTLTPGQLAAVEVMVSSPDRFVGIQGDAGTGKTYAVKQAVALIAQASGNSKDSGFRTLALAPYGNQVKVLKEEGLQARTLASFLAMKDKPIDSRTVVVLDEAGVVPSRQMAHLMRIVETAGARMVLMGDTKQTEAIEAGKPFAQLQESGMHTVRISEILRQKDSDLKFAVQQAAEGNVLSSLGHVGPITVISDPTQRHAALVDDYMQLNAKERVAALIVAGTNAARREINDLVRQAMQLEGRGRPCDTLLRVDMTRAQRRYAPSYQPGTVIQPERDYPRAGLMRGGIYRVTEARPGNELAVRSEVGRELIINPRKLTKLSVYREEHLELSVGDAVRINRNDPQRDLTNGDRLRVVGIMGGVVTLESFEQRPGRLPRSWELLASRPLHLEHAYATTAHSAQGTTAEQAFITLDTKSRTTSMNLYYVAISRAKHRSKTFTNDRGGLPVAISRHHEKTTALSIHDERQASSNSPLRSSLRANLGALSPNAQRAAKAATPREPDEIRQKQFGR